MACGMTPELMKQLLAMQEKDQASSALKDLEQIEKEKINTGFRRTTRHQINRKDGHRSMHYPSPNPLVKAAQEAASSTSTLLRAKLLAELKTPAVDPHSNPNKPRSLRKTAIINDTI